MLKVAFTFLFLLNLQAQNLYDSNCLQFVKKHNFINGKTPEDLIQSSKRTERYFYWDRITKQYSNFIKSEELKKEASQRYSGNLDYKITKCDNGIDNCNAYKAYCIEEVSMKGITEEIKKWNDKVKNCLNKKYRDNFPHYCDKDFSRSLLYLKRMAQSLAKTNQSKSPDVALFFNEAKDQFQKYYDDIENLLTSMKDEKNKKLEDQLKAEKKEEVINKLNICRDLIKSDDNDIGNKMYIDRLLGNYSKCNQLNPADNIPKTAIQSLEKLMTDIDLKTHERYILPEITEVALNQSTKATVATYIRFFGENIDLSSSTDRSIFVKKVCQKMRHKRRARIQNCERPGFKASMYLAMQELHEETKNNPLKAISNEQLEKDTKHFNKALIEANTVCKEIYNQAKAIRNNHKCSSAIGSYDKFDRMNKSAQSDIADCEDIKKKKFSALNKLSDDNGPIARGLYSKATSTIAGHLLVTEDFRDTVNLPSQNWVKERCIDGDGHAFNHVTFSDVQDGLKDLLKLNLNELSDIADEKYSKANKRSIIKDYLKNNPNTIVDLLNQNPDENYAKAICSFIREINSDDYLKVWGERIAVGVGTAAGVALSATGIGSPIGVPLLAAVGTATAAEAGIIIYDINELNYNNTQQSQASSTGQFEINSALDSIGNNEDELTSRKIDLALTLSFGTLDLTTEGFKTARTFYKANKTIKANKTLRTTASIASSTSKNVPYQIARGLDEFSYHARKIKLTPELLEDLSDLEKLEIGAIYSKLSKQEQRALTMALAEGKDIQSFIKGLQSIDVDNFEEVFKLANKRNNTIAGKNLENAFSESDGLLYLNNARKSKNTDKLKSEKLAKNFSDWFYSSERIIPKELVEEIEEQLIRNDVPFEILGNSFKLKARVLKEGEQYTSDIERFVSRMNKLGVDVRYDPQYLKSSKIQAAYGLDSATVFIDNFSVLSNRTSGIAFHEGSHAYGAEKYLQGIDDDFNISFSSANGSKIFAPIELQGKKVPYSDGFWAQESKVFSNEIRQNTWAKNIDTDAIRRNTQTLKLINQNAIENTDRLLTEIEVLKNYLNKDLTDMVKRSLSVTKKKIKGKEVFDLHLINESAKINKNGYQSDIKTSIQVVTNKQKKALQNFLANREDPKNLREMIDLFEDKALNYQALTKENDQILDKILAKNTEILKLNVVSKANQKELIDLSAQLSKTTKTPTPLNKKFNKYAYVKKSNNKASNTTGKISSKQLNDDSFITKHKTFKEIINDALKISQKGSKRAAKNSSKWTQISLDQQIKKFYTNKESITSYANRDGKVIILPKEMILGNKYNQITLDPAGKYFRVEYVTCCQKKIDPLGIERKIGKKPKNFFTRFRDYNGNLINTWTSKNGSTYNLPDQMNKLKQDNMYEEFQNHFLEKTHFGVTTY